MRTVSHLALIGLRPCPWGPRTGMGLGPSAASSLTGVVVARLTLVDSLGVPRSTTTRSAGTVAEPGAAGHAAPSKTGDILEIDADDPAMTRLSSDYLVAHSPTHNAVLAESPRTPGNEWSDRSSPQLLM